MLKLSLLPNRPKVLRSLLSVCGGCAVSLLIGCTSQRSGQDLSVLGDSRQRSPRVMVPEVIDAQNGKGGSTTEKAKHFAASGAWSVLSRKGYVPVQGELRGEEVAAIKAVLARKSDEPGISGIVTGREDPTVLVVLEEKTLGHAVVSAYLLQSNTGEVLWWDRGRFGIVSGAILMPPLGVVMLVALPFDRGAPQACTAAGEAMDSLPEFDSPHCPLR